MAGEEGPRSMSLPGRNLDNAYFALYQDRTRQLMELGLADVDRGRAISPLLAAYMSLMRDAIFEIADAAPKGVVEVGAGTGYWASLLHAGGVDVVAYDAAPVDSGGRNGHHAVSAGATAAATSSGGSAQPGTGMINAPSFFRVAAGTAATAAGAHPDRALMLCWPPPEVDSGPVETPPEVREMGHSALSAYRGDTLIYVGDLPEDLTGASVEPRWVLSHPGAAGTGDPALSGPETGDEGRRGARGTVAAASSSGGGGGGKDNNDPPAGKTRAQAVGAAAEARLFSTGGQLLHAALRQDWRLERRMAVPQWPMARDTLTVWRRRDGRSPPTGAGAGFEGEGQPRLGVSRPLTAAEQQDAAKLRADILDHHRMLWEDSAVAALLERKRAGGARPAPGVEMEAVAAALQRAPFLRRVITRGLFLL